MPEGTEKQWTDIAFYATIAINFEGGKWGELVARAVDGVDLSAQTDRMEAELYDAIYREG